MFKEDCNSYKEKFLTILKPNRCLIKGASIKITRSSFHWKLIRFVSLLAINGFYHVICGKLFENDQKFRPTYMKRKSAITVTERETVHLCQKRNRPTSSPRFSYTQYTKIREDAIQMVTDITIYMTICYLVCRLHLIVLLGLSKL